MNNEDTLRHMQAALNALLERYSGRLEDVALSLDMPESVLRKLQAGHDIPGTLALRLLFALDTPADGWFVDRVEDVCLRASRDGQTASRRLGAAHHYLLEVRLAPGRAELVPNEGHNSVLIYIQSGMVDVLGSARSSRLVAGDCIVCPPTRIVIRNVAERVASCIISWRQING